jgi:hypothetical protein
MLQTFPRDPLADGGREADRGASPATPVRRTKNGKCRSHAFTDACGNSSDDDDDLLGLVLDRVLLSLLFVRNDDEGGRVAASSAVCSCCSLFFFLPLRLLLLVAPSVVQLVVLSISICCDRVLIPSLFWSDAG